jgi:hypothetical protein
VSLFLSFSFRHSLSHTRPQRTSALQAILQMALVLSELLDASGMFGENKSSRRPGGAIDLCFGQSECRFCFCNQTLVQHHFPCSLLVQHALEAHALAPSIEVPDLMGIVAFHARLAGKFR